jgi:hypothetical protein
VSVEAHLAQQLFGLSPSFRFSLFGHHETNAHTVPHPHRPARFPHRMAGMSLPAPVRFRGVCVRVASANRGSHHGRVWANSHTSATHTPAAVPTAALFFTQARPLSCSGVRATNLATRATLKSGGEGRYVRPGEDKSPLADEDIYFDPADLEDEVEVNGMDDFDDDDDDDDENDWFFVPEGAMSAMINDSAVDLFNIDDEDDDDSDSDFGFAKGFVETEAEQFGGGFGDDGYSKKNKSNRPRRRRDVDDDTKKDSSDGMKPGRGENGEREELTPKQIAADKKKDEDTVRAFPTHHIPPTDCPYETDIYFYNVRRGC